MQNTLQKAVFGIAALLLSFGAYAQDIIVTTDAKKIEAKITEVTKSEVRYKQQDYLDGPTFVISTDEISSIIYANGNVVMYNQSVDDEILTDEQKTIYTAAEFNGDSLPKFVLTKVAIPGKKYKKKRFVGGNMVLTEKEFSKFIKVHCPEAYTYYEHARTFLILECVSILIGLIPVIIFAVVGINYSTKILPTYNNMCAGHHAATVYLQPDIHDKVQLATIVQ